MAQVNLYVPDQLYDTLREKGADLNWSELFRERALEALGELASCGHPEVRCTRCGTRVSA